MTVEELIEALKALPKDAQQKPVTMVINAFDGVERLDVDTVDYDLRVVTLR